MTCPCSEKEESGLFSFWVEELRWMGYFLTIEQRVHRKNSTYG